MYDELVKRLRKLSGTDNLSEFDEAADAIEELSKPRWIPVTEEPTLKVGDDCYNGYLAYANGYYEVADYTTDKFDIREVLEEDDGE